MTNILKGIGLVIAGLAVGWLVSAGMHQQDTHATGGIYNQVQQVYDQAGIHVGPNGSSLVQIIDTTCTATVYASLAATSSQPFDCPVTGIIAGDRVTMQLLPGADIGPSYNFSAIGAGASSTSGYARGIIYNLTGAATSSYSQATSSVHVTVWR